MACRQRFRDRHPARWLAVAVLALAAAALVIATRLPIGGGSTALPSAPGASPPPGGPDARALASAVADLVASGADGLSETDGLSAWLPGDARGLAYVALRAGGERLASAWSDAGTPEAAMAEAVLDAAGRLTAGERSDIDVVEVTIPGPDAGELEVDGVVADNLDRGILGVRLELADGGQLGFAPTRMIADNTSFGRVVDLTREEGLEPTRAILFTATQLLVDVDRRTVHQLTRGAQVVPASAVTRESVESLATGMADWLFRQLGDDGRMVYEYYPSRGDESSSNNMIRQWMATVAMTRVGIEREDDELLRRVERNIEFNLSRSYSEENGHGLIADPDGDVKLGAIALAALAIGQHPAGDRWAAEAAALLRTVDSLWQPDGSFKTFYRPADRNDNQNFYPGEALLLWATALESEPAAKGLMDRFMASFRYYRDWHREQRNPAFVPWHTMAYEKVWNLTGDAALRDFVFEMNDWLLEMQQWEDAPADDVAGRFYNPDRPDYGPPHASSDGVYLEGLIASYRLAVGVEDDDRAESYRTAIARVTRNLMQLQFADEIDMYYVSQQDRVRGGLRTTVYDNRIRVDNVQHGLMGVLDVLDAFAPADYRIEDR
jgi:hypothetical protein